MACGGGNRLLGLGLRDRGSGCTLRVTCSLSTVRCRFGSASRPIGAGSRNWMWPCSLSWRTSSHADRDRGCSARHRGSTGAVMWGYLVTMTAYVLKSRDCSLASPMSANSLPRGACRWVSDVFMKSDRCSRTLRPM